MTPMLTLSLALSFNGTFLRSTSVAIFKRGP
jgi:hypothetical protein